MNFLRETPTAFPLFFRSYSRITENGRETLDDVADRLIPWLCELGGLSEEEKALLYSTLRRGITFPSGRALWCGGTEWSKKPGNEPGVYNCFSAVLDDSAVFGHCMDFAMQGTGTGTVLEKKYTEKLPPIRYRLHVEATGKPGDKKPREHTEAQIGNGIIKIVVGDSRKGWIFAYQLLIDTAMGRMFSPATGTSFSVEVDLSHIRPKGAPLNGFGGVANPDALPAMFEAVGRILSGAAGRKLRPLECCLILDEAAKAVVAGNIRRSASMRQFDADDEEASKSKLNLWKQDKDGKWSIDPERDALRMANHTRVFHHKPSYEEILDSVNLQYRSGEGAIQYAPEAEMRAKGKERYGLNPCVTADTWIHTGNGPRQVKDLIGKQHSTYVNGELFSTTPEGFFLSGEKPVMKLATEEGYELRLTSNHQVLRVMAQTQKKQYTEWVPAGELEPGDRILLHDHRGIKPWDGLGNYEDGYLRGELVGISERQAITPLMERSGYEYYRGLLGGLFNVNGSVEKAWRGNDVSVRLSLHNLTSLQAIQRMLSRLGIVSNILKEGNGLTIAKDNLFCFDRIIGFCDPQKAAKLHELLPAYVCRIVCEQFTATVQSIEADGVEPVYDCTVPGPECFDANGFMAHNCGEIIGKNFFCNLSEVHLNRLDPNDDQGIEDAFTAAALHVAVLLNQRFTIERYQKSREEDPIVGVSFTGLFDFCIAKFGVEWLQWFAEGRPRNPEGVNFVNQEAAMLSHWREIVHNAVWRYCDRQGLKRPNRCTTVQPAGSKSLLTGASPGWHPPKAQRFIRRITTGANDAIALACMDYGYTVVPSPECTGKDGKILDDPMDPRATTWLIEIPVEVPWANLEGADEIDISKLPAVAQFDFFMQVQKFYTAHNTSATIELRESEVEALAKRIHSAIRDDEGYISAALLARFDDSQTFPRLPFEPIDKATYDALAEQVKARRKSDDFLELLSKYTADQSQNQGPAPCDSDKCLL